MKKKNAIKINFSKSYVKKGNEQINNCVELTIASYPVVKDVLITLITRCLQSLQKYLISSSIEKDEISRTINFIFIFLQKKLYATYSKVFIAEIWKQIL